MVLLILFVVFGILSVIQCDDIYYSTCCGANSAILVAENYVNEPITPEILLNASDLEKGGFSPTGLAVIPKVGLFFVVNSEIFFYDLFYSKNITMIYSVKNLGSSVEYLTKVQNVDNEWKIYFATVNYMESMTDYYIGGLSVIDLNSKRVTELMKWNNSNYELAKKIPQRVIVPKSGKQIIVVFEKWTSVGPSTDGLIFFQADLESQKLIKLASQDFDQIYQYFFSPDEKTLFYGTGSIVEVWKVDFPTFENLARVYYGGGNAIGRNSVSMFLEDLNEEDCVILTQSLFETDCAVKKTPHPPNFGVNALDVIF